MADKGGWVNQAPVLRFADRAPAPHVAESPSPRLDAAWCSHVCRLIANAHDRGVINEVGLFDVCTKVPDERSLTLEHFIAILGTRSTYRNLRIAPDNTAAQLVFEAMDAMFNPDTRVDLRDWLKAAEALVGPLRLRHADDPTDAA